MLRGLIIMSLISMQLAYIYQAREWLPVKKKKKPEISTNRESNSANHDRSIKLNTFASYIKLYVDAVTNNAYLDY